MFIQSKIAPHDNSKQYRTSGNELTFNRSIPAEFTSEITRSPCGKEDSPCNGKQDTPTLRKKPAKNNSPSIEITPKDLYSVPVVLSVK